MPCMEEPDIRIDRKWETYLQGFLVPIMENRSANEVPLGFFLLQVVVVESRYCILLKASIKWFIRSLNRVVIPRVVLSDVSE
jgi:hypothetical protein